MKKSMTKVFAGLLVLASVMVLTPVLAGTDVGEPATNFTLQQINGGKKVTLSQLKGKPTLVVFWATWCPPCRREIPLLKKLDKEYGPKGLQIVALALNYRETQDVVAKFIKDHELPYTVLWDEDNKTADAYSVTGIPTAVLVDANGVIRFRGHQLDDPAFMGLLKDYTSSKAS